MHHARSFDGSEIKPTVADAILLWQCRFQIPGGGCSWAGTGLDWFLRRPQRLFRLGNYGSWAHEVIADGVRKTSVLPFHELRSCPVMLA